MISVVIPAHNEQGRIGRCLEALLAGSKPDELEIVVVANGCSDGTAEEARGFGPPVLVLESAIPSKVAALNTGDEHATAFPRFYVDGDVVITLDDLRLVARALLDRPVHLAAPARDWRTDQSPWIVRSYVRILRALPQVEAGVTGGGVLGISEIGRQRFDRFPDVLGDDLFLESLFTTDERCVVREARTHVEMPRTLSGLVRRRTRVVLVNRDVSVARVGATPSRWRNLGRSIRKQPRLLLDVPTFLGVTLLAELRARWFLKRGTITWERDESARSG